MENLSRGLCILLTLVGAWSTNIAVAKERYLATYESRHIGAVNVSPTGKSVAVGLAGSPYPDDKNPAQVDVLNFRSGKKLHSFRAKFGSLEAMSFSPDGKWIALAVGTGGWRVRSEADPKWPKVLGAVFLWNLADKKKNRTLLIPSGKAYSLAFMPDSKRLVIGSGDTRLRMWNYVLDKIVWNVPGRGAHVTSLAISPDGNSIVSANWDSRIRVWNSKTGVQQRVLSDQRAQADIFFVVANFRNRTLVSAGNDGIFQWNLHTGRIIRTLEQSYNGSNALRLSPNLNYMSATGKYDVRLWDMRTGKVRKVFSVPNQSGADFSPDNKYLVYSDSGDFEVGPFKSYVKVYSL